MSIHSQFFRSERRDQNNAAKNSICITDIHILIHDSPSTPTSASIYSFAFATCAFAKTGSNFVAFITSPLTLSFPPMNSLCAFAFPVTNFPKSSSERLSVTVGLSPSPLPTSPLLLRSMCQLSVSPALFFSVNAKTALPCLIAALRSASDEVSALLMTSKASEEGNASMFVD